MYSPPSTNVNVFCLQEKKKEVVRMPRDLVQPAIYKLECFLFADVCVYTRARACTHTHTHTHKHTHTHTHTHTLTHTHTHTNARDAVRWSHQSCHNLNPIP